MISSIFCIFSASVYRLLGRQTCRVLIDMLVIIEDGFYLNTVHIIAIRIAKSAELGTFQVNVEYSPHNHQASGLFQKTFMQQSAAEHYLQNLHQQISKS